MRQVIADGGLQFSDAAESAAPDTALSKQAKEALDLVQPTGTRGSKLQVIAGLIAPVWPGNSNAMRIRLPTDSSSSTCHRCGLGGEPILWLRSLSWHQSVH